MARPLRIEYPGGVYHVTVRGNERRDIFRDDEDRTEFLEILDYAIKTHGNRLYSYVLMNNHFHLLLETPLGDLGEFMRRFNITYTGYFNRRHNRVGHLYQGRYKSIVVEKDEYLSVLSRYIHLNPIRTRQFAEVSDIDKWDYLKLYRWSSLPGYIDIGKKEDSIDYRTVLGEYGGDNDRGRRAYGKRIAGEISEGLEIRSKITGQCILGSDGFIERIKEEFLNGLKDRECPSLGEVQRYRAKEEVVGAIEKATGKRLEEIRAEGGGIRQIAMDALCRVGGLKGKEIGAMFGVDYSTVSQGRRRLHERLLKDQHLKGLSMRIERELSR
jgi:putative transposase